MANPVQVANKAIILVGGIPILSFDDDTTEAIAVKASFDMVRDRVLEARQWTFADKRIKLTPDAVAPEFDYSHRFLIPSDVIRVLKVDDLRGMGELMWEREGEYILTDASEIQVKYIKRVNDVNKWTPSAIDCFSFSLASELAMPLTEDVQKVQLYAGMYSNKLIDAGATDGAQGRAEQLRSTKLKRRR